MLDQKGYGQKATGKFVAKNNLNYSNIFIISISSKSPIRFQAFGPNQPLYYHYYVMLTAISYVSHAYQVDGILTIVGI